MSDAQPTSRQTYPRPPGIGTQAFARMAAAHDLHVVEVVELADTAITAITVEGREANLAIFSERLEQMARLLAGQDLPRTQ